jgi:hypothetical protein
VPVGRPAARLKAVDQEVAKTLGELELKLQELERELTTVGHRDKSPEPLPHAAGKLVDEAVEGEDGDALGGPAVSKGEDGNALGGAEAFEGKDRDTFGGSAVFGGEAVPSQAGAVGQDDLAGEVRETAYGEIPTPAPPPSTSSIHASHSPPGPPKSSFSPRGAPNSSFSAPGLQDSPSPPTGIHPPSSPPPASPSLQGFHPASSSSPRSPFPPPSSPDPRRPAAVEESQSVDLAELVRFRDKLARTMDELIEEYSRLLSAKPPPRSRADA